MGLLSEMAAGSEQRLVEARAVISDAKLRMRCAALPPLPRLQLSAEGFDLIAELKLRSPALGDLSARTMDPVARLRGYAEAGAAICSVLTEPSRFDGDLSHLRQAATTLAPYGVPAMRKDFLVDPYQVLEARAAGAGGALLIVRMLEESLLAGMLEDIIATYGRQFTELEARLPQSGQERLLATVEFLVDDIWRPESRRFFMNLFAASCHSVSAGRLLNDVYAHHRRRIAGYVAAARPGLTERECLDRGLLLAGLIDGLMIYTAPDARAVSSRAQLAELDRGAVLRLID